MNVYHRDFDTTNDAVDNLFIAKAGSASQNSSHGDYAKKLMGACEHRHEAIIVEALVKYGTQVLAAEALGVSKSTITYHVGVLRARIKKEDGGTA